MKYIITILTVSFFLNANSQEFSYTVDGILPENIITDHSGNKYKEVVTWIQKSYENPKKVIVADRPEEYLKVTAMCLNCLSMKSVSYDVKYSFEVDFKDDKYRFTPTSFQIWHIQTGWREQLNNAAGYFKKDGSLRKAFKEVPDQISNHFNRLLKSMRKYKSDW